MGWLLLRRFVDLVGVYSLLLIVRNHSNTFLLINLLKRKLVQSKIVKKGLLFSDTRVLIGCCPLRDVYFNIVQIKRWQIFKDTFSTEHLRTTASEARRVFFLRSFFCFFE